MNLSLISLEIGVTLIGALVFALYVAYFLLLAVGGTVYWVGTLIPKPA